MENIYWKKTVGTLIGAIWLYTLADLAASITGVVNELLNPSGALGMLKDLMEGESGAPTLSMGDIVESMFSILVIVGYYLFFRSLTRFARLQSNQQDGEHVSTVRTAYILLLVAIIVDFVPMIGWLASFVLMVIAYVKMLSGYRGLKKSYTFPSEARQGAATLYSCTIWTLVGYVLGYIPLFGGIIEGIITLVVFFTILSAWGRIKAGAPNMTPEEEEIYKRDEVPAYKRILGDTLIVVFGVSLLSGVLNFVGYMGWSHFEPYVLHHNGIITTFYNGLLGIIFDVFADLLMLALYLWMFCSKNLNLSSVSKSGLILLMMVELHALFNMMVDLQFITFGAEGLSNELRGYGGVISHIFWMIGLCLFIISSQASKALKVVVSLSPFVFSLWSFVLRPLINSNWLSIAGYEEASEQAWDNFFKFNSGVSLSISILFFVLVFLFVRKWKQKTLLEMSSNSLLKE